MKRVSSIQCSGFSMCAVGLAVLALLLSTFGCQTKQAPTQSKPAVQVQTSPVAATPAPPSTPAAPAASALGAAAPNGVADRPEKLSFPPLTYEPPAPEK